MILSVLLLAAMLGAMIYGYVGWDVKGHLLRWAGGGKRMIPTADVDRAVMRWWVADNEDKIAFRGITVQDDWCLAHPWADGSPTAGVIARMRRDFYNTQPDDPATPVDAQRFEDELSAALADKERFDREKRAVPERPAARPVAFRPTESQIATALRLLDQKGAAYMIERYGRALKTNKQWAAAIAVALDQDPDVERVDFTAGPPEFFENSLVAQITAHKQQLLRIQSIPPAQVGGVYPIVSGS
jgi:hypothetical protein